MGSVKKSCDTRTRHPRETSSGKEAARGLGYPTELVCQLVKLPHSSCYHHSQKARVGQLEEGLATVIHWGQGFVFLAVALDVFTRQYEAGT